MIRHVWSILCSKSSVDRQTNSISLFEVIEGIQFVTAGPVNFPADVPFEAQVVSLWLRSDPAVPEHGQMRSKLIGPSNQNLGESISEIDLRSNSRVRTVGQFNGLRIDGAGIYEWEISSRDNKDSMWRPEAHIPFEIAINVDPSLGKSSSTS